MLRQALYLQYRSQPRLTVKSITGCLWFLYKGNPKAKQILFTRVLLQFDQRPVNDMQTAGNSSASRCGAAEKPDRHAMAPSAGWTGDSAEKLTLFAEGKKPHTRKKNKTVSSSDRLENSTQHWSSTSKASFLHHCLSSYTPLAEDCNDYILIRHPWDSQPALKSLLPEMNRSHTCFHHPH